MLAAASVNMGSELTLTACWMNARFRPIRNMLADPLCATGTSRRAAVEALWKQEGAKCCRFLRNPAHGTRTAVGFKRRKCRKNTQTSAIVHGLFDTTHNLKFTG